MGGGIWSVTKTCPIYSQYNGYWYFYEDIGKLAAKWLPPQVSEQPGQKPPQIAGDAQQTKEQQFTELYTDMRRHLELAYNLIQQLQGFDWQPFESITLTFKDADGVNKAMAMADVLPPTNILKPALTQCDLCNAVAVKFWLQNPNSRPVEQGDARLTPSQWQVLRYQLESEANEAERQVKDLETDTSKTFADIDKRLSGLPTDTNTTYVESFKGRHAGYTMLLDDALSNLEQAKKLAMGLRNWGFNPEDSNSP